MAEIPNGIFGEVTGKLGNVVAVNWRGKNVLRSLPSKKKTMASQSQLMQREKFKRVGQFMAPLKKISNAYFGEPIGTKSRANLAMSYHLKKAAVIVEERVEMEYAKVVITKGVLPPLLVDELTFSKGVLTLRWTSIPGMSLGKESDTVAVILYSESVNEFYRVEGEAIRSDGALTVIILETWQGNSCFAWLYTTSEDGLYCSTSQYLGIV